MYLSKFSPTYIPPCRQTRGFGLRCGGLANALNKGGDNLMEKASERRGFRPTFLPKGGGITL